MGGKRTKESAKIVAMLQTPGTVFVKKSTKDSVASFGRIVRLAHVDQLKGQKVRVEYAYPEKGYVRSRVAVVNDLVNAVARLGTQADWERELLAVARTKVAKSSAREQPTSVLEVMPLTSIGAANEHQKRLDQDAYDRRRDERIASRTRDRALEGIAQSAGDEALVVHLACCEPSSGLASSPYAASSFRVSSRPKASMNSLASSSLATLPRTSS